MNTVVSRRVIVSLPSFSVTPPLIKPSLGALSQYEKAGSFKPLFLADPRAGWSSDPAFSSLPIEGFVPGPAMVTVFTDGIPSDAEYVIVP